MTSQPDIETICFQVLDRFMKALNAHDTQEMDAVMNFPHVRIANGTVVTYPEPGHNPLDLFDRPTAEDGWRHSAWNDRQCRKSWRVKVPLPSIARFGRRAYPLFGEVTN